MSDLTTFLAEQYAAELQLFRASLDAVPDEQFNVAALSHSPAWHALHIADWLRLVVLNDRTPNYHHLVWETVEGIQKLGLQPAVLNEDAGKAAVLARLDEVGAQAVAFLTAMTPDDLNGMTFSPSAPSGERPRLLALGMHLRHVGYHRGQLQLAQKVQG